MREQQRELRAQWEDSRMPLWKMLVWAVLLGAVALAKQQGLARRVVIAAPNSLVFNWAREIERVLPDFRFAIIGARAKVVQRGAKRGELISEPDTPAQRAAKWQRFQAGLYDLVVLTYSALPRTQLDLPSILQIVRSVPAVQRELVLKVRETERRIESLEVSDGATIVSRCLMRHIQTASRGTALRSNSGTLSLPVWRSSNLVMTGP